MKNDVLMKNELMCNFIVSFKRKVLFSDLHSLNAMILNKDLIGRHEI